MSIKALGAVLAVTLSAVVAVRLGIDQLQMPQNQKEATGSRLAQAHVQPASTVLTQIPVTFTTAAPLRQFYNGRSTTFEALRSSEEWSLLETSDVALINHSIAGAQLCPEALADFMASFAPKALGTTLHVSYGVPARTLHEITTRLQGKTVPVNVRIPRFDAAPPGLEKCPDFGWVAQTHRLSYRGKPVAVMVAEQPQLAAVH